MKTTTLNKEEFITRSMAGETVIRNGIHRYFYDTTQENPFRCNDFPLVNDWRYFDGRTVFEIEEPKPIMERRWKWRNNDEGFTVESAYLSDYFTEKNAYHRRGWYKIEDLYIDVEVKQ